MGTDFQALHDSVIISYGGKEPAITFCALTSVVTEPPTLFPNLTKDCKPIATKSRKHSDLDKQFITKEIQFLLKNCIIEPSSSPWRAQVLVVNEPKKRMVIDYSQTVNRYTLLNAYPSPSIDEMVNKIAQYEVFSTVDMRSAYYQMPINTDDKQYTAFEAGGKLYQFCCMPFGLTNAVACFQ